MSSAGRVLDQDKRRKWTLVGDGPMRRELEMSDPALSFGDRFTLAGALPHAEILWLLSRASAFILPCETRPGASDGIPVAIMEAMAAGVPVVTTAIGGISELVEDGVTGFIVPPADPVALANAVNRVLQLDADEREAVVEAARARVREDFDVDVEAAKLLAHLRAVSDGRL